MLALFVYVISLPHIHLWKEKGCNDWIYRREKRKSIIIFEFFLNLFAFLSEERGCEKKFDDQFLAKTDKYLPNFYIINLKAASSHIQYYILDKVFIQVSSLACKVYVEVSPLHSLSTMVCEVADSVVCQVAMLPSFNSLWG